jgi:membrane fusion protein, multidrug efflux system
MNTSIAEEEEIEAQNETQPPPKKRSWTRWIVLLIALLVVAFIASRIVGKNKAESAKAGKMGPPAVPIAAAVVKNGDIPVYLTGLGSVTAFNTVTVKTRVDGQLVKVNFQEGQNVKAGDLLAQIDPRPFQVQLEQAQGQLAKDEATLNNAKVDLTRYQTLYQQDAIPKQQLDTQVATVAQLQGTLTADQAAIHNAQLQLSYSNITAPISGKVGLRQVDIGNMVHASDENGLLVITQVEPISVVFTLPEDSLNTVREQLAVQHQLVTDAYDRSGINKIASGTLSTIDNQIDPATGTVKLKAIFENKNESLYPNQFVNIKLLTEVKKNVVIAPVVAIQEGPQGTYVYVVKQDQTVTLRKVTPGTPSGNVTSIESGLSAGDKVVVDGMDKLREGSKVRVEAADHNSSHNSGSGRRSAK